MSQSDPGHTGEHGPPSSASSGQDWDVARKKLMGATGADRIILIAGAVFIVCSFLPWYGVSLGAFHANVSGWNAGGVAVIAILCAIAATVFAAARVLGAKISMGSGGVLYLVLGGAALGFTLLRWVTETRFTKYGLFVALLAGIFLTFGGFQKYKQSNG